jgi:hypothetical protein
VTVAVMSARGGFVFGFTETIGDLMARPRVVGEPSRDSLVSCIGPRLGWLWGPAGVGVIGGADAGYGQFFEPAPDASSDRPSRDAWLFRLSAALRISLGEPVGATGAILPAQHRSPSPLRSWTVDLGYSRWLTHREDLGGGFMMMFGGMIASF